MKTHFTDMFDIDVPIIDADAHVNEPPDLWQTRVPAALARARAQGAAHRRRRLLVVRGRQAIARPRSHRDRRA